MATQSSPLNSRERATLRAVGQGRAEITCSCEPDLYVDGLCYCDQFTARLLVRRDLIAPSRHGRVGERVPAQLTEAANGRLSRSLWPSGCTS